MDEEIHLNISPNIEIHKNMGPKKEEGIKRNTSKIYIREN
jgi:hypothetical protein